MPFRGGQRGLILRPHVVDGDTIEHWELGEDLIPDLSPANNDFDVGYYVPGPLPGSTTRSCCVSPLNADYGISGAEGGSLAPLSGELSVAVCVYLGTNPGGATNYPLFRHAPFDQGSDTEANNTIYDLAYASTTGALRIFWENGAGNNNTYTTSLNLPEHQWSHVVWTRNSDLVSGSIYLNGVKEDYTMSNAATVSVNNVLNLGNGNQGAPSYLSFYSLIFKDIALTQAQVTSMRGQTGLLYA